MLQGWFLGTYLSTDFNSVAEFCEGSTQGAGQRPVRGPVRGHANNCDCQLASASGVKRTTLVPGRREPGPTADTKVPGDTQHKAEQPRKGCSLFPAVYRMFLSVAWLSEQGKNK